MEMFVSQVNLFSYLFMRLVQTFTKFIDKPLLTVILIYIKFGFGSPCVTYQKWKFVISIRQPTVPSRNNAFFINNCWVWGGGGNGSERYLIVFANKLIQADLKIHVCIKLKENMSKIATSRAKKPANIITIQCVPFATLAIGIF